MQTCGAAWTVRLLAGTALLAAGMVVDRRLLAKLPCWVPMPTRLLAEVLRSWQRNRPPRIGCGS